MLWVALHFPQLPLEALLRGRAPSEARGEPWAVVQGREVLACDPAARALGVRPGMALSSAWALAPRLCAKPHDPSTEREALAAIAGWLCQFTPSVSLEPPQGVLAEVRGSLRLFGGLEPLAARLRAGVAEIGFTARLAAAPTARGAWWLALGAGEELIEERSQLERALAALPVAAIGCEPHSLALLADVGVATLGDLWRLPRDGVARRFGQTLLDALDQARGSLPEARAFYRLPERFGTRLELPAPVTQAESVLFAARRLLVQLEGFLAARHAGIRRFALKLGYRDARDRAVEIGLAAPARDAEHFTRLLRERLLGLTLTEPIEAIALEAGALVPLPGATAGLFRDARAESEGWARLVERLEARLGDGTVHGLAVHPEHRPEHAWCRVAPLGGRPPAAGAGPRPLWLLEPARHLKEAGGVPQDGGPLELLAGPERIESGWWDGGEVARDYFIARSPDAALLWVYLERGTPGGWYLHGIFA
jgi:protein ImuB